MGRILEALRRTGPARPSVDRPPEPPPLAAVAAKDPPPEIPFIEVGGPGVIVAGSTDVLRAPLPPKARRANGALPALVPPAATGAPRPTAGPAPVSFSFRPAPPSVSPRPVAERFAPELVTYHRPDDPLSRQYAQLLDSICLPHAPAGGQVLFFTAPARSPSQTTVVLNLGIAAARKGRRVLVVEVPASPSAVAAQLGLPDGPGLGEWLTGRAGLQDAVRESGLPGFAALTGGSAAAWDMSSANKALTSLRRSADLVLVDGPAWDNSPALQALGAASDVAYLVLPQVEADSAVGRDLIQAISSHGIRVGGCILTSP